MSTLGPLPGAARPVPADPVQAAMAARVGVLAFRDGQGRPAAWPVTPYADAGLLAVTSTLAYLRKAEHIRRDPRIALLAGGWLTQGRAEVIADPSGDRFVERLADQERAKFPPFAQIEAVPASRLIFGWYYGRAHILLDPASGRPQAGDDGAVLVTIGADGLPAILPVPVTPAEAEDGARIDCGPPARAVPDGAALLLCHAEDPGMEDLRALHVRGRLESGWLTVTRRYGSLRPAGRQGILARLGEQARLWRRGRDGRRRMRGWA